MTDTTPVQAPAATQGNGRAVDVKALIRRPSRPEKTVPVALGCGALLAEHEELDRKLKALLVLPGADRLNDPNKREARKLAERIGQLESEMAANTITFRFRGLAEKPWTELVSAHPPRKGEDGQVHPRDGMGVNVDTFAPEVIRACVVEPELDDEDWRILLDPTEEEQAAGLGLSDAQFDNLFSAAWLANRQVADVPFSRPAWRLTHPSSQESKPPSG